MRERTHTRSKMHCLQYLYNIDGSVIVDKLTSYLAKDSHSLDTTGTADNMQN